MGRWLMALLLVMLSSLATRAAEAYACYTSSNTTLTFYYDSQRSSRPGIKFDMNEGSEQPRWITSGYNANVTSVVISPSFANARPTSTYYWFYHMNQITTVNGLNYLNTEAVTNMSNMFYECSNLTSLDVSGFNTSNVTDMGQMFCECSRLTALDVSHFNTANVVNMTQMFCFCSSLTALDVSDFNTANVTTMYGLFQGCLKLTALDVSNFTTPKAMRLSFMFQGCSKLTALDVSNFNTANVTEMNSMFNGCSNLTTIYASSLWRTDAVTSSTNMFKGCTSLVGGMGTTYDADHVDAAYAHIDGGTSNPGYFTELVLEPYACYTPENTTLTFYYDTQRSSRTGTTYDLNTGSFIPGWNNVHTNVTKVVFDPSFANARPTSTYGWFYAMEKLQFITGMSYLNTSEVTNMSSMFFFCSALTSLDLSSFNTANVTDMSRMFYYCKKLTSLDLSSFNTAKVTDMCDMFRNCSSLSSLDLSSFNTANVTDMSDMFRGGSSLSSLDLSSFNTAKVTNMTNMFYNCTNLRTIYVGSGWSTAAVEYSLSMFRDCSSLVGGQGTTYDESHVNAAYAHIDGGPSNPGYFTGKPKEAYACYTSDNTTLTFYYDHLRNARPGTTYDMNPTGYNHPGWYSDGTYSSVTQVVFDPSFADARPTSTFNWFNTMTNLQSISGMSYLNTSEVTEMGNMFNNCSGLTSLDVSNFSTANVTTMIHMFYGCSGLTNLDVSGFNTSNVTNMYCMFSGCSGLTSLDLSGFNTANVTAMGCMFSGCSGLTSLDVSNFNTANVRNMDSMFDCCSGLTSLDLSNFNTAKVTSMVKMFLGCSGLTSLDLSNFNTDNVTSLYYMFSGCSGLKSVDLSNFNTSNVTHMTGMFNICGALKTIYVGDAWSTAAVTSSAYMFSHCTSLVGGMGTTYDANHVDAAYAHLDGGPSNPGYFSEKLDYIRGDVNNDGKVSIIDVTFLINYLLTQDATGINLQGADTTLNNIININDVSFLINYLLTGSW